MIENRERENYLPIAVKLSLIITLLISVTSLALGTLIMHKQSWLLKRQIGGFGRIISEQTAQMVQESLLANDSLNLEIVAKNLQEQPLVKGIVILDDQYRIEVKRGQIPGPQLLSPESLKSRQLEWIYAGQKRIAFASAVRAKQLTIGYVLLSYDHGDLFNIQDYTLNSTLGITVLFVVVGILVSFKLGKRLTRPIYELVDISKRISQGEYGIEMPDRRRDELGTLMLSMNSMSEGLYNKVQVEQIFSRYVSSKVANKVLSNIQQTEIGGELREASVLFADVIGFTSLSEKLEPNDLSNLLNKYFDIIARAAEAYNGNVDKYVGDCAMLVFGVPEDDPEHALHAVSCALLISSLVQSSNNWALLYKQPTLNFHIGVNSGEMLAGNIGAQERMEYTVVGDAVNLASRLSRSSQNNDIIISGLVLKKYGLQEKVLSEPVGSIRLRGKTEETAIYRILSLKGSYQTSLNNKIRELQDVSIYN